MFTVSNCKNEYIINKSKFITYLYNISSINEFNKYLDELKKEYKDATHICYAYIIDNVKRFNDDSEPGGTAGMPILNVLEKNNLNYVVCFVVRYFGGIKLGAGGLTRAYSSSVTVCLKLSNIKELIECYRISIEINYDDIKKVDNLLKDYKITYKEFDELVKYEVLIPITEYERLNIKNKIIDKEKTTL